MARAKQSLVYVGIKQFVIALDRKTGAEVWRTELEAKYQSAGSFVNVVRDRDGLFASCAGEIFSLDPANGAVLWHDALKGLGTGLVTIATDQGGASSVPVFEEAVRQQQAAAAASA